MFKSPGHGVYPKKGQISFNKLATSPRHHNSAKMITPDGQYSINQFNRQPGSILTV